jgi:DNA repair exonuclease SbcCD nuclease subunit
MSEEEEERMIRFIHAADLHLDRPFEGLSDLPRPLHERVRNSTFKALDKMVDITLSEQADFLIIAGDIFDSSHRSITAQHRFIHAMKKLSEASVPVYLVFGNHDHLDDPWNHLRLPENVHVFSDKPEMIPFQKKNGERVHLYGFSYRQRRVRDNMAARYQKEDGADYHIGILHGALLKGNREDTYAPFSLKDLTEKDFNYWALGHIHKRMQLSPELPVWYPGDTQGLSVKETGDKGVSCVELNGMEAHVRFCPTADIIWMRKGISIQGELTADTLEVKIGQIREEMRRTDETGVFLLLDLSVAGSDQHFEGTEELFQELLDAMNEDETYRDDFVWLLSGVVRFMQQWEPGQILKSPHFLGDVFRLIESDQAINEALSPLLQHRLGRRYLDAPDEETAARIKAEAEQILAESLFPGSASGAAERGAEESGRLHRK